MLLRERVGTITVKPSVYGEGYELKFTPAVLADIQGEQTWVDPYAKNPKQAAHGSRAYDLAKMGTVGHRPDALRIGRVNRKGEAPVTVRKPLRRTFHQLLNKIT